MTPESRGVVLKGPYAENFLMCNASPREISESSKEDTRSTLTVHLPPLREFVHVAWPQRRPSWPSTRHCARRVRQNYERNSSTHASASFSALSAKVTLCLAASSDRSVPRPLRPRNPVLAVPDPMLPRRLWRVESTSALSALPVERLRKNPPLRDVPVVVPLSLGGVVRVSGAVVATLSVAREDEKIVPRLRGVAVS